VRGYSEQAVEVIAQPGRIAWDVFDETRERLIPASPTTTRFARSAA
jgi:hypothetical protein